MNWRAEAETLRRELSSLAAAPDAMLTRRYVLRRRVVPRTLYWQLRRLAAETLGLLGRLGLRDASPWPVRLRHADGTGDAKPLLIWAIGTDGATLRQACEGFAALQHSLPDFAPVLVTDVADFAFYSRLGWLVEYVPELDGVGDAYAARKLRLLATVYRDAPALPVIVGLQMPAHQEQIRDWIRCGR